MVLMRTLPLLAIACATAPTHSTQTAQRVSLAFVIDGPEPEDGDQRYAVADQLGAKLNRGQYRFDLVPSETFDGVRSQTERVRSLIAKSATRWATLVEVNPRYLNLSAGRFRWEVATRVSVVDRQAQRTVAQRSWNLAAHLTRSNQDALDALDAVLDELSERLTLLLRSTSSAQPASTEQTRQKPRLFYLAMVDRFADADPSNNEAVDREDPQGWHGGDLAGITQNIDHLVALGVTDIWLTPIFTSRSKKFDGHGAFHGYWTYDLDQVDARFGGLDAAKALRAATRAAGIRLHLDFVTNHVAWDSPLRAQNPNWFHPNQSINNPEDATERERGWVHGLPDLAQENPAVKDYLIGRALHWVQALQPDGFRLDALTHVPVDFVRALGQTLGDKVELFGEFYDGRAHVLAERWRATGIQSAFDFPSHFALINTICGDQPMHALASVLALDRLYERPERLLTFVDNHDLPRLASKCGQDPKRVALALSVLFSLRGTPVITWGTESGLAGKGEPENRADMVFDRTHPSFQHLQALVRQRAAQPVLASGKTLVLGSSAQRLDLLRYDDAQAVWVTVNKGAEASALDPAMLPSGVTLKPASARGTVGAMSVAWSELVIDQRADFTRWLSEQQRTRSVRIVAPNTDGEVVAVGSAPELGSWQPAQAVRLEPKGDVLVGTVELPASSVVALKLARVTKDGATWSDQANTYFKTSALRGDVELAW